MVSAEGRVSMQRAVVAIFIGIVTAAVLGRIAPWQLTVAFAWSAFGLALLAQMTPLILRTDGPSTARLATVEDDSRAAAHAFLLAASSASLLAVGAALRRAGQVDGGDQVITTLAAVLAVVVSWLIVQAVFTLRYAHRYYSAPVGGIAFQGSDTPDFRDFAYVAFTIGMTYQVADTDTTTREFRGLILWHSLLSYLFGTVIVATAINVIANFI